MVFGQQVPMLLQVPLVLVSLLWVWPVLLQSLANTCVVNAPALERMATPAVLYVAKVLADVNLLALLPGGRIFRSPPALETPRGQLCSLYLIVFIWAACVAPLCAYYLHERRSKRRYLALARGEPAPTVSGGDASFNFFTAALACVAALQLSALVWWVMLTWLDVCRISGACPVPP
jgi:hypothetical protein